jgi:cyclophilin family peptidyl-prolyl cis-trans isomerase
LPVRLLLPGLSLLVAALLACSASGQAVLQPPGLYAEIKTPRGTILCRLEPDLAPLAVASFVGLAEGTLGPSPRKAFFDGLTFHRVVPHFVIQGGDPKGTGEGGPGYSFPDEFTPLLTHGKVGALSMANDGPDTNGSQFFITLEPVDRLDFLHTVFGQVVSGMEVLPLVAQGDAMTVRILRNGEKAAAYRVTPDSFDALKAAAKPYAFGQDPGPSEHFDDPDKLLPQDPPRAKNFNFKLGNVERSTGLRLYARVMKSSGGKDPASMLDHLAWSLGIADSGVLTVYFADRGAWLTRVGDKLRERFVGAMDPSLDPFTPASLAQAMDVFAKEAAKRTDVYLQQSQRVLPNILQSPEQRLRVSTDAQLSLLIEKLARR